MSLDFATFAWRNNVEISIKPLEDYYNAIEMTMKKAESSFTSKMLLTNEEDFNDCLKAALWHLNREIERKENECV